jgi:cob(I)alamin adenosyltransferase
MSIATKTGDEGETWLVYGRRGPENRCSGRSIRSVDELNAALGWLMARYAETLKR